MPRKVSKDSPRNYFTKETEEYIIKYNNSTDTVEREKIFTEHLYYPFYKLAECIIHSFKFYHIDVEKIEDLKLDIVRMIWEEKIGLFDPTKNAKAFSYFGTIIKRWLIAYTRTNYKLEKNKVPVDFCENNSFEEDEYVLDSSMSISSIVDYWIEDITKNIGNLFEKEQERLVAEAVLTVFRSRRDLEEFGKRAIFVYVREITGCEQPCLTKVVKTLKSSFYKEIQNLKDRDILLDEAYFGT